MKIAPKFISGKKFSYDSLGEAYMLSGESELAIQNYQRSIEMNPGNKNGAEMLKKLQAN